MKRKIYQTALLLLLFAFLTGCGYAGPEKAVRQELDLIRELDESTIKAFVSYEALHLSGDSASEIGEETTDAVKLFFKDFKYSIRSSSMSQDGSTATVTVSVTNLDAEALAKDLCRAMIRQSQNYSTGEDTENLSSSFSLMKTCLENNIYESKTTTVTFQLINQNDVWIIQENEELEDQLAGGLASYLSDPYLLPPDEVLDITLEPFREFTSVQWLAYLNIDDIFAVGNDLSTQLDHALADQLAACFDYKITGVSQEADNAYVETEITSFDLESVISECRSQLLAYAETTESIRATEEELSQKTASILLNALTANSSTVTHDVSIRLSNNGSMWEAILDERFTDALLGGIDDAVSILYTNSSDS